MTIGLTRAGMRESRQMEAAAQRRTLLMLLNQDYVRGVPYISPEAQETLSEVVRNTQAAIRDIAAAQPMDGKTYLELRHIEEHLRPLNEEFSTHCVLVPWVTVDLEDGAGFRVGESVTGGAKGDFWRASALLALRSLLQSGTFETLRVCENQKCGRWFLAKRENQRWCSQKCRQTVFQSTDEFRAKRRSVYEAKKVLVKAKKEAHHAKGTK